METTDRLPEEPRTDWRRGLGEYANSDDGDEFERVVTESKQDTGIGTSQRTDEVLEAMGFELDERGNVLSYPAGGSQDERAEDTDDGR